MSALRDAIDFTTLGWIKPELDETLRQARIEIEAFAEDPSDASRMRFCASYLHQVQGTLRMVELYAPAMVAEEMESLAQALQEHRTPSLEEACATLMRGVVLLPDYLERLQGGHKDIPIVLLPLLNELRAARGEAGLSESVLFAPDLQRPLPAPLATDVVESRDARESAAGPLLAQLHDALSAWPEDGAPANGATLSTALDGLVAHAGEEADRRMLWVAASVAQALRDGAMPASPALRQAFTSVEREARRLFGQRDAGMPARADGALEPTRQLLYHVAQSDNDHAALQTLRDTFELGSETPTASELEHARGSLTGRNRALLDTVSAAIKEDLLRVKDVLDLHLRSSQADIAGLQPQVEALDRVADTLGMLGLGVARNVVQQQRDAMHALVSGERPADEGALLDIAGALLYVDASLDEQVAHLGGRDANADESMLASESRKVLEIVVREAIANFADARQAFVAFVETSWDHAELAEVPRLLQEVSGALQMLDLKLPADYLTGVRLYAERELIDRHRVPNGRQLDTLADALASLEYYLEALREQRANRDDILDIARNSLESLQYWPLPVAQAPAAVQVDDAVADAGELELPVDAPAATAMQAEEPSFVLPEIVPPKAVEPLAAAAAPVSTPAPASVVPAAPVGAGSGGFEITGDEIDDEIREVFLEEFEEEIGNLDQLLPPWRAAPDDSEKLRPIRRVFHTLKGSGRLVGARTLGEFSWKVENMLNRVLDGTRPASPAVLAMVDQAFFTLPQLHAALRGEGSIQADLDAMQALADRIAAGEDVFYSAPAAVEPAAPVADAAVVEAQPAEVAAATPSAEDGIAASIDPLLLEILDTEIGGHLTTVERWIADARQAPAVADDILLRAIHTMNGAFAMTEVPSITDAMTPAEAYVKRLLAARAQATTEGVDALADLVAAAHATVAALHSPSPRVPRCNALAARLAALRDSLPDASLPLGDAGFAAFDDLEATPADTLTADDLSQYMDLVAPAASEIPAGADFLAPTDDVPAPETFADVAADANADAPAPVDAVDAEAIARLEAERAAEEERLEYERLEAEYAEQARVAREQAERAEAERAEAERAEAERAEAERAEAERAEAERAEAERAEAERAEAERAEAERAEA
ncbi:MAG TPA: Hpt domain-containing protein, partial [Luteimonas sp.]|nr:Hpt domain-containing protein [Luteimonas sp.]